MAAGGGNQNSAKAYRGLRTVLCTVYVASFGKLMISVKCGTDARDSAVWFTDRSGFNNERALSLYFSST